MGHREVRREAQVRLLSAGTKMKLIRADTGSDGGKRYIDILAIEEGQTLDFTTSVSRKMIIIIINNRSENM